MDWTWVEREKIDIPNGEMSMPILRGLLSTAVPCWLSPLTGTSTEEEPSLFSPEAFAWTLTTPNRRIGIGFLNGKVAEHGGAVTLPLFLGLAEKLTALGDSRGAEQDVEKESAWAIVIKKDWNQSWIKMENLEFLSFSD